MSDGAAPSTTKKWKCAKSKKQKAESRKENIWERYRRTKIAKARATATTTKLPDR